MFRGCDGVGIGSVARRSSVSLICWSIFSFASSTNSFISDVSSVSWLSRASRIVSLI